MPKFNVHLFPIVRVKFQDIEAATAAEAITKAIEAFEFHGCELRNETEFADAFERYVVDPIGEDGTEDLDNSAWFYDVAQLSCQQMAASKENPYPPGALDGLADQVIEQVNANLKEKP